MYRGFLRYDGTEVINVARTMAYVGAGYRTPDTDFSTPVAYAGLAEALGAEYTTPLHDAAPWYDEARVETHGFAGVLPLDITGLSDSTRTAEVVENITDGGVAQKARRASKVIAVQALLVGDTAAAAYAGLEWLTTVLHRTCTEGVSYAGAQLEGFLTLPEATTGVEDLDAPLVDTPVDGTDPGWRTIGGTWAGGTDTFTVPPQAAEPVGSVDGGFPWTTDPTPGLDGGDVAGAGGSGTDTDGGAPTAPGPGVLDGGAVEPSEFTAAADGGPVAQLETPDAYVDGGWLHDPHPTPYARLIVPVELSCESRVEVTWTLAPLEGTTDVQIGAVDPLGRELRREPVVTLTGEETITWVWEHGTWEDWRPAVWVSTPGAVVQVSVATRPTLDPEECLAPLRRTYADLTTVAGPTVVAEYADDCDNKLLQVEWTWTAGNPYRYGAAHDLAVGVSGTADVPPTSNATDVGVDYLGLVSAASTECAEPVPPVSCAYDPAYPGFVAPPTAPVIVDPGMPVVTDYKRSLVTLDLPVVPDDSREALTFRFANDATAKHGVRVRMWQQDDPDFATADECGFAAEFWVNYIDSGATLVVDTVAGQVLAVCDDDSVAPAAGVMRGPYRGAFEFPVMGCGGRWFITVDVPSDQGSLTWDLAAAPREG